LQYLQLDKTVKGDNLVLQQEQNKFCPAHQVNSPTANGDSIISKFNGLCIALLHHETVKIDSTFERKKKV